MCRGLQDLTASGFCQHCDHEADRHDAAADGRCWHCGRLPAPGAGLPCPGCRSLFDPVLEVGVDPGAAGAYAWDLIAAVTSEGGASRLCLDPRVAVSIITGLLHVDGVPTSGVRDLGVEERVTTTGKTRRLASADCLADELRTLVAWARAQVEEHLGLEGHRLRLVAHVELPPAAPGQGSAATASQHRSLGRIEGVLTALGFEVRLHRPQAWRARVGLGRSGSSLAGEAKHANQRAAKLASVAEAKRVRPDLAGKIGESGDRAEAVLVLLAGRLWRQERQEQEKGRGDHVETNG
jgi:hypothetical protein